MLGIRAVDRVEVVADQGDVVQVAAGELIGQLEAAGFLRLSAGAGVQGPRWWDWARLELATPTVHGHRRWLLVRRHPTDPTELAFFMCVGPPGTPLAVLSGSRAPVGAWRRRSRPPRGRRAGPRRGPPL